MLQLLRKARWHVVFALVAGLLLRLWFIHYYPVIDGDTLVYGDLAHNWFWHGIYGLTKPIGIRPTLIRLPGYPLFLGICFFFFGVDHYGKILVLQAIIDLVSCLLVSEFATRAISRRAGIATLYLSALCPFTANYVASPLTETPSIFCIALGLYALLRYVERPTWRSVWFWALAFSISYATLLRPDGALLGVTLVPAMFWYGRKHILGILSFKLAIACTLVTLVPFVAWTARNASTFHVFQPLAPRYANDPGEFVPRGWIRWIRTWTGDYASTAEIYWSVNGSPLDITLLPSRAFDGPAQKAETEKLFDQYNKTQIMTPALSRQFGQLARERIANHPLRYHVGLPLMRLEDMWLRPRVAQLWIELRWWQYRHHPAETVFSWSYAALNGVYLLLAVLGLRKRVPLTAVMVWYVAIRCLLLLTIESPESRYTLECFPMIFILAGAALSGFRDRRPRVTKTIATVNHNVSA